MGLFNSFKNKKTTSTQPTMQQTRGESTGNQSFRMMVEDVFLIKNHGVVLTGKIQSGMIRVNDMVTVNNARYTVTLIDVIPNQVQYATAGMNVGLHLSTLDASLFKHGDMVTTNPITNNEYLNDTTFIRELKHTNINPWHQYDVLLEARGYGWDMMISWADYMAQTDLEHVSQVTAGSLGIQENDFTNSYLHNGSKCSQTPELRTEMGMLSIAGQSKTLKAPMKIVWMNQTRTLRFFTLIDDETLLSKYIETTIRRTFGTENAMKLGKPIPTEKVPLPNASARDTQTFVCNVCKKELPVKYLHKNNICSDCAKDIPLPKVTKATAKNIKPFKLGKIFYTDEDRQRIKAVAQQYLPKNLDTPDVQLQFWKHLTNVMSTVTIDIKTELLWRISRELTEEQAKERFTSALVETILLVNHTIECQSAASLTHKVNTASFEELIKAWTVLDYYTYVLKPEHTKNIQSFRDYIHRRLLEFESETTTAYPIIFNDNSIHFDSKAFWKCKEQRPLDPQFDYTAVLPLKEKEPIIFLYEDGIKTREYCLQTEGTEDFTGKYFFICVRLSMHGNPSVPVAQIDGFVSDTPEDHKMSSNEIGYRMEGHFLACGGAAAKQRYEMNRGQDLPMKALKYPGYTTPSNVRLMGICPDCGKSFSFHGYAFYMMQSDIAYSDDGLDCCEIQAYDIDKDNWIYETEGKIFRYYNSFNCPHCGTPYIDYKKHPENKVFGVSGCVHLGRTHYKYTD